MKEGKEMSFLDHLEELRWRLVRIASVIVLIAIVLWIFQEWIIDHVFLSMKDPSFISFKFMCDYFGMCIDEIPVKMQSTTMGGQFGYAMMMSMLGGVVLSFPFIFYQIWAFVKPGLKANEQSVVKGIVFYVSLLFFLGIAFGYFIVAPMCVQFFGTYQMSKNIDNIFTINSYMSTILSTVFYSGLLFLLPVVAYLFAKLGIITAVFLRKYRKHAIVGVLILSAVITPPDLISQVIVSIPIVLLYEISILVTAGVERNRRKEEIV
ncbi:MAG: twin-arginine translocase subunit TatC [Crocinitomicaceae bacterium]|nr:MAG: twin-arginine translocase subunit TatC [Crocinitomicaceae bacterium]